jgi:hypothetical protein
MPSLINTTELDTEFPVPGQDNDSQGFRDNFTNVKTNLDTAKTEIETLQDTTVKINADTIFLTSSAGNPAQLIRANLKSFSTAKFPAAADDEEITSTQLILDFDEGDYQVYQFTQPDVVIDFVEAGWPSSGSVGKITLELSSKPGANNENSTTISFENGLDIKFGGSWDAEGTITIPDTGNPVFIELWTRQGGTTIFARNLGEFN